MVEAFLFPLPRPLFATMVVLVARLVTLAQTFLIMVTAMAHAMMLMMFPILPASSCPAPAVREIPIDLNL